ncbi:hypothetical protein V474_24550 [Novosphingobium barchaimii LL02]|uniref:Uncharacterized protein n=1 Tax=Novosphingobium barchaimii LL02 TaxID=1114963 RepID=A0A0J8ACV9_9SPHN|nr:hypothetical protein [Novosphingobium barchaimii]KMS52945.1 hypothetical protein V474_24550 [Novosphingobium barchaimii LL02]
MAEQKRRNAGAEPISRHPLFPVIVALWCGALFGLGSIMVSPQAIEGLVLATGLHKVIPMAAPPLGTTTRILLALAMTGLGAAIGAVVARRIVHPKGAHERSRPAQQLASDGFEAAEPSLADAAETAGAAPAEAQPTEVIRPGRIPGRRRALALNTEDDVVPYEDRAPIPGRDTPILDAQILNVAEFDLDRFDHADPAFRPTPRAPSIETEDDGDLPAWLDAESAWHEPEQDDRVNFAPSVPADAQVFQQVFQAQLNREADDIEGTVETTDAELPIGHPFAPVTNRLFEAYSREVSSVTADPATAEPGFKLLPRLHSGAWSKEEAPKPAPFCAEIEAGQVEAREPETVAELGTWAQNAFDAPTIISAIEDAPVAFEENIFAPQAFAPPFAETTFAEEAFQPDETREDTAPLQAVAVSSEQQASGRIAEANLDDLSHVELLERLALAMGERREQARRAAEIAAAAIPAEFAPLREVPPVAAASPQFTQPGIESEAAFAPVPDAPSEENFDAGFDPHRSIPAALRPVTFEDYAEDYGSDEALPGYIPPRHIGLTSLDTPFEQDRQHDVEASFAPASFPASPFTADEEGENDEDVVLQEGYSSLLNLSRHAAAPQRRFAEVETFEEETDHRGTVHDLLGQEAREAVPFSRPALAPAPVNDAPAPERLFDSPDARPDQETTEKALRAALATLQRMSGAA